MEFCLEENSSSSSSSDDFINWKLKRSSGEGEEEGEE